MGDEAKQTHIGHFEPSRLGKTSSFLLKITGTPDRCLSFDDARDIYHCAIEDGQTYADLKREDFGGFKYFGSDDPFDEPYMEIMLKDNVTFRNAVELSKNLTRASELYCTSEVVQT